MKNVRVNTVMDEDLLQQVDAYARERREDRSTAIRQLVASALREQRVAEAIEAIRAGRITLRSFATRLDLDLWDAHDLLAASGGPIGTVSAEETAAALDEVAAVAAASGSRRGG